jgi:hypothetical protein
MSAPTQKNIEFSPSPLSGADFASELVALLRSMAALQEGSTAPSGLLEGQWWADSSVSPNVTLRRRMADGTDVSVVTINKTTKAVTFAGIGTLAAQNSPCPVANGGTGSTTAANARTALSLHSRAELIISTATRENTSFGTTTTTIYDTGSFSAVPGQLYLVQACLFGLKAGDVGNVEIWVGGGSGLSISHELVDRRAIANGTFAFPITAFRLASSSGSNYIRMWAKTSAGEVSSVYSNGGLTVYRLGI